MQSAAGSFFGGAVAAVIWLCSGNVAFTVVAALTGIFGSVMMCTKDQNNQSVVDQVGNMVRFAEFRKTGKYRIKKKSASHSPATIILYWQIKLIKEIICMNNYSE